jgi:hypothetical protein
MRLKESAVTNTCNFVCAYLSGLLSGLKHEMRLEHDSLKEAVLMGSQK